jgi:hydrogenase expression/formation protein HypD
MKYLNEYRDKAHLQALVAAIRKAAAHPWHIMEICGGQTHAIARYRLEDMLPDGVRLLHGPGCPVCVTPAETIDHALDIAGHPEVIFASFGDMMRVPGTDEDLLSAKAKGADVRILYSPVDAIDLAEKNTDREVVFFAVGFETTIPVHLTALKEAQRRGLKNFSLMTAFFTVPPAIDAILSDPGNKVDAFLAAGHVCSVMGYKEYYPLARHFRKPIVVTGFEPVDILYGIYRCILQLESGKAEVENAYKRAVTEDGNLKAQALMNEYLERCTRQWRGIGIIPDSGLHLRKAYEQYDAALKFPHTEVKTTGHSPEMLCIAGDIMKGNKQVADCPYFGSACNPERPVGAPMVSAEGVCAAYYKYGGFAGVSQVSQR